MTNILARITGKAWDIPPVPQFKDEVDFVASLLTVASPKKVISRPKKVAVRPKRIATSPKKVAINPKQEAGKNKTA